LLTTYSNNHCSSKWRKGEFSAKSSAWKENKGLREGKLLEVRLDLGRWFIVKRAARMESVKP